MNYFFLLTGQNYLRLGWNTER